MSEITEFLTDIPMFQHLKSKHIKQVASRMKERTYQEGETIIEQGTNGVGLYVIARGQTDVTVAHADGTTRVIDHKGVKDFVGELSLLDDFPRTASVIATENVKCYVLFKLDFLDLLRDEPEIAIDILREVTARFRRLVTSM